MNRVLRIGIYFLAASVLFACGGASSSGVASGKPATFSGTITDASNISVYFEQYNMAKANHIIGSKQIGADGSFKLDLPTGYEPGLYRLRVGQSKLIFPVDGGESAISINGTLKDLMNYGVQFNGSKRAATYASVLNKWKTGQVKYPDLEGELKKLDPVSAMAAAISIGGKSKSFLGLHDAMYDRLNTGEMQSQYTSDYATYINAIKNPAPAPKKQVQPQRKRPASKFNVGDEAPNIALKSPDGKQYSLKELRGQVVLLDFWASWCGPCRRENPAVVKIYDKYKKDGFTVFSVSLDGSTDKWSRAIAQDKLTWPYHVSDLKKWKSGPAREYGVSSIPKTFMIDRDGKIASIGLRGAHNIEKALLDIL